MELFVKKLTALTRYLFSRIAQSNIFDVLLCYSTMQITQVMEVILLPDLQASNQLRSS